MKQFAQFINWVFDWGNPSKVMLEIGEFNPTTFERGEIMDNQKILNKAIELLKELDLTDSESVQFNHTKFEDGSSLIEVGVSYPGPVVKKADTAER